MKFVPAHTVSYKGVFYDAGETVDIDAKDKEEMSQHGKVELPAPSSSTEKQQEAPKKKQTKSRKGKDNDAD